MKDFITKEETISEFSFPCNCGCGNLKFTQWKDDGVAFISYNIPAFSAYQNGTWDRIKKALCIFWELVVMGREYRLYEIVIDDNKQIDAFKSFVSKMRHINESHT